MMRLLPLALLLVAAPLFGSSQEMPDLLSAALNTGNYGMFVAVLGAADLAATLQAPYGPFTVFAPQDSAFSRLPAGLLDCLLLPANKGRLKSILSYHIVSGEYSSTELIASSLLPTLNFNSLLFGTRPTTGELLVNNGVTVVQPDIMGSNGVVHGVNSVILPIDLDVFAFLATCPKQSVPATSTGTSTPPVTTTTTTTPPVTTTTTTTTTPPVTTTTPPVTTTTPPVTTTTPPVASSTAPAAGSGSVMDMLMAYPELSSLWDLVVTLGLSDDLAGGGPFTVFAPTNAAFAAIASSAATMDTAALTRVVMYHVIVGEAIPRNGFMTGTDMTLSGYPIDIAVVPNSSRVVLGGGAAGPAQITGSPIVASNGIIHKVDKVLLPPTALPVVSLNGQPLWDKDNKSSNTQTNNNSQGGGGKDDKKKDDKKKDSKSKKD